VIKIYSKDISLLLVYTCCFDIFPLTFGYPN
jgi:hypothetical protein